MKLLFLSFLICCAPSWILAQQKDNKSTGEKSVDSIYINEINGIDVFESDTFYQAAQKIIEEKKIMIPDEDYPKIYFSNTGTNKYFKIWLGSDAGYGWFFTIGYLQNGKCGDCGTFLGKDANADYIVNNGIKLGDDVKAVWNLAHLNYFRKFSLRGVTYYYYERGIKYEAPFTPSYMYYYKFGSNGKLIEIGFGYGMMGQNPMMHSEQ